MMGESLLDRRGFRRAQSTRTRKAERPQGSTVERVRRFVEVHGCRRAFVVCWL